MFLYGKKNVAGFGKCGMFGKAREG